MTGFSVETFVVLLLIASVVAIISRRLKVAYSVGLVVAGIAIAVLPTGVDLPLTRELIFNVLLPPLVFEAALQLDWTSFRRDLPLTLALAFPGVALDAKGRVVVDAATHRTGNPKVYSGGDCVNGGKEVVNAAAEAKVAVRAMGAAFAEGAK